MGSSKITWLTNTRNLAYTYIWVGIHRFAFGDEVLFGVFFVPSVAEWSKALESDASAGGESPVRAPVRAVTLCPYA